MIININNPLQPMPTLSKEEVAHLKNTIQAVKDIYNKEQLESISRAVLYTRQFKHEESMSKMDEEEFLQREVALPKLTTKELRELGR
jgi:hypothetical protein